MSNLAFAAEARVDIWTLEKAWQAAQARKAKREDYVHADIRAFLAQQILLDHVLKLPACFSRLAARPPPAKPA
ncbi:MAG: hypothetical protein LBF93_07265 [Zoogloeaceae bacterium]|nr:hypothetical protein [Zoogloeaceae bacterium]